MPGGYVDFDDYRWTLARSPSMSPEAFPDCAGSTPTSRSTSRRSRSWSTCWCGATPATSEVVPDKIFRKARRRDRASASASRPATRRRFLGEACAARSPRTSRTGGARPRRRLGRRDRRECWLPSATRGCASAATRRPLGVAANRNSLRRERARRATSRGSTPTTPTCRARSRADSRCSSATRGVGLVHGGFQVIDDAGRAAAALAGACSSDDRREPGADAFRELARRRTRSRPRPWSCARSAQRAAGPFATRSAPAAATGTCGCGSRCAATSPTAPPPSPATASTRDTISSRHGAKRRAAALRRARRRARPAARAQRLVVDRAGAASQRARAALAARALRAGRRPPHAPAGAGERCAPSPSPGGSRRRRPPRGAPALMLAIARGDDYRGYRQTQADAGRAGRAAGVAALRPRGWRGRVAADPDYEQMTARAAAQATTAHAAPTRCVARSPSGIRRCCWLSRPPRVQFPDRRRLPDGYPGGDDARGRAPRAAAGRTASRTLRSPRPLAGGSTTTRPSPSTCDERHRCCTTTPTAWSTRCAMSGAAS